MTYERVFSMVRGERRDMFTTYRTRTTRRLRSLPAATSAVRSSWIAWMASVVVTRKAA